MDAVSGLVPGTGGSNVGTGGLGSMSSADFTKIILEELSAQDPMEPNDTAALLEQIGTIRRIESDTGITDKLSLLVGQNEFASAAGLIGSRVSGISLNNDAVQDVVVSVSKTREGPLLTLASGDRMLFADLSEVAVAPAEEETP